MFYMLRPIVLALLLVFGLTATGPRSADAAAPPWPNSSYAYYAQNDPLRDVLETFGRSFGVRTEISRAVTGSVDGRLFADTPDVFLDRLAQAYGITWYYHGGTLHIDSASESVSEPIEMTAEDIPAVRDALNGLGVFEDRFGWGEFPDRGVIIVSGPPSYVGLVRRTLSMLPVGRSDTMAISVFRLKHASVDDRTFFYRDRQVTIPGVATILRNIVTNQSYANTGTRTEPIATMSIPRVQGRGTQATVLSGAGNQMPGTGGIIPAATDPATATGGAPQQRFDAPTESPVIQADTRLNAIIVKDVGERMASYADLIDLLDIPTALIEIEAAVVDVNTNKMKDLGVRWQGQAGGIAGGFGAIETANPTNTSIAVGLARNASLQTILAGTGDFFLSKITALESTGDAAVLSRPSVLTLDNLEAVLDLSETFYIPVQGERVAEVVSVTAGVLLKVTPRLIVDPSGKNRIKLDIDVEDGTIQPDTQISKLPTVRRSTISTQAVIGESESLLIGGYYFKTDVENEDKVPLLGDIPLLGMLFSSTQKEHQQRERMFMITPRLIEVPMADGSMQPVQQPAGNQPPQPVE